MEDKKERTNFNGKTEDEQGCQGKASRRQDVSRNSKISVEVKNDRTRKFSDLQSEGPVEMTKDKQKEKQIRYIERTGIKQKLKVKNKYIRNVVRRVKRR